MTSPRRDVYHAREVYMTTWCHSRLFQNRAGAKIDCSRYMLGVRRYVKCSQKIKHLLLMLMLILMTQIQITAHQTVTRTKLKPGYWQRVRARGLPCYCKLFLSRGHITAYTDAHTLDIIVRTLSADHQSIFTAPYPRHQCCFPHLRFQLAPH